MSEPKSQVPGGCLPTGSLIGAAVFYFLSFAGTIEPSTHNPEDGMLLGFVMLGEIALWTCLGLFVGHACARAGLPRGIRAAALLLVVAGGVACITAFDLMGTHPDWLAVTPILLPPLALTFGLWARNAPSPPPRELRRTAIVYGLLALPLLLAPALAYQRQIADAPAREAYRVQEERRQEQEYAAMEARCRALGPASPLEDYLEFLDGGFCWEVAHARARSSPRRQADALRLLGHGPLDRLTKLSELDLQPTPELCRSYGRAVDRRLGQLHAADPAAAQENAMQLDEQITNLNWFMAHGCDLAPQLRRMAAEYRRREAGTGSAIMADEFDRIARNGVRTAP